MCGELSAMMTNKSQTHPIYTIYNENMVLARKTQIGTQNNKIKQNKDARKAWHTQSTPTTTWRI